MSTDPSVAARGRDEATADAPALPAAAAPPRDLAELAAAIARLEALIAADAAPGPDGSAAVERIADIAFVLHEREVEASLCDALDAAVREISDSGVLGSASTQRTQEAAALLRDLSRRVNDLVSLTQANEDAELPAAAQAAGGAAEPEAASFDDGEVVAEADEEIPAALFAADVPEDDEFARVFAALAGSLPAPPDQADPISGPPPGAAAVAAQSTYGPQSDETARVIEARDTVILGELLTEPSAPPNVTPNVTDGEPSAEQSSADATLVSAEQSSADATLVEEIVNEQASSDVPPAPLPSPLAAEAAAEPIFSEPASNETRSNETAPSETVSAEILPSAELGVDSSAVASEDLASPAALVLPAPDVIAPPSVIAPPDVIAPPSVTAPPSIGESLPPVSPRAVANVDIEPALSVAAALADHEDAAQRDGESGAEMFAPGEPERQSAVEATDRSAAAAAEIADEFIAPVEPEPARTLLPETQPAIDPDEDPGDLFEPMTIAVTAAVAASGEAGTPAVAPPEGSVAENVAEIVEKTPPPVSDSEQRLVPSAQAASGSPDNQAHAPLPVAKPDTKAQAQPVPLPPTPRPAPADPLAPVRALSEEEMIALFS